MAFEFQGQPTGLVGAFGAYGALGAWERYEPQRSLITYYDDATGERTELSAPELGAWSCRVAHLLADECGLLPGDQVTLLLPPHWQTAAVILGAWSVGLTVGVRLAATAGLAPIGLEAGQDSDVVFVSRARRRDLIEVVPEAPVRFLLDLGPRRDQSPDPDGYRDFLAAVSEHSDRPVPSEVIRSTDRATADGSTFGQWERLAHSLSRSQGIGRGDRVLVDVTEREHPAWWLLTPLLAGASVVLCANLDPDRLSGRLAAEGINRRL